MFPMETHGNAVAARTAAFASRLSDENLNRCQADGCIFLHRRGVFGVTQQSLSQPR